MHLNPFLCKKTLTKIASHCLFIFLILSTMFSSSSFSKTADSVLEKATTKYDDIKNFSSTETVSLVFPKKSIIERKNIKVLIEQKLLHGEYSQDNSPEDAVDFYFYTNEKEKDVIFVLKDAKKNAWERIKNEDLNTEYFYSANAAGNYYDILTNIKQVTKIVEISYKSNRVYALEGYLNSAATRRWLLFEDYGEYLERLGYSGEYIAKHFSSIGLGKFKLYISTETFLPLEYHLDLTTPRNNLINISLNLAKKSQHIKAREIVEELLAVSNAKSYVFENQLFDINSTIEFDIPTEVLKAK